MARPPKLDPEMSAADVASLANVLRRSLAGKELDDRHILVVARTLKRVRADEDVPHRSRLIGLLEGVLAECLNGQDVETELREVIALLVRPLRRKSA